MNARNVILSLVFVLLFGLDIQEIKAQAAAIDGTNIGFMESTPPSFNGWIAKTGTYSITYGSTNSTAFSWTTTYNDPSSATFSSWGSSGSTAFVINTTTTEYDANTNGNLKKIPTQLGFTRSVRLGPTEFGGVAAELSYRLKVNDTNSLLTFCYAMVLTAPHPGDHYANPTFEVDVVEDNSDNLLTECLFFQNCGDVNTSNLPSGWHKGKTSSYSDEWIYLDWQQITVNLENFLNETVKLRIRVSGCGYSAHAGYGYFAAKVGKPSISLSGCAGEGDTVTTAEAPIGFNKYEWFHIPEGITDQYDIDSYFSSDSVVSTDRILAVTNTLMNNEDSRTFAVRLTSPTQHVSWDNSPAPACVTYIPATVNDMRPRFDSMQVHKYIPTDPENPEDEIGFFFEDVQPRNNNYPLDWQLFAFGDGDSLEFKKDNDGHWKPDEDATPLAENHVRITYNSVTQQPDTVFHTYKTGEYTFTRCAHSYALDPTDTLQCTKCDTLHIIVPVRPSLLLTSVDTVCFGDKVTIKATSPGDDATGYTYQWWYADADVNSTEPFFTGSVLEINSLEEDLIVHVKVTTTDGFYRWGWDTVIVQAFPDIQIEGDTMICIGETLHLTATDLSGGTLGMKWTYQRPNANTEIPPTSNSVTLEDAVKQDTLVFIVASTTNGCVSYKSAQIIVVDPKVTSNKKEICIGDEVILTGSGAVDYSWAANPKDATLEEDVKGMNPVKVAPIETTEYTMTGYGQNGCAAKTNITITIVPDPIVKFGFSPNFVDMDAPFVTFTDSSTFSDKSEWIFSDGSKMEGGTVTHEFNVLSVDSVSVHLITSNRLGCSQEGDTTLPVSLFAVWVPNAFTPDGDGINDYFFFMTKNDMEDVVFEVFDRWGTKVFSYDVKKYTYTGDADIAKLGWNGKYNGKYVQNGSYVWRLSYRRPDNTRVYDRQGTVMSIR
ncbi:MAG: gliding motility-associated C-terminal domain-containing protein [Bacteroidales bacterium]|nr:gliding motility-associated C-terminal domain-containing protein [Bacteroidales bacterium]